jgi:hypothetical protein
MQTSYSCWRSFAVWPYIRVDGGVGGAVFGVWPYIRANGGVGGEALSCGLIIIRVDGGVGGEALPCGII